MVATVARTTNPLPWWFGPMKKLCYWPVDTKVAKSCPEQVLVRTVLEHPAVQGLESQLLVDTDGVLKPSSYFIKGYSDMVYYRSSLENGSDQLIVTLDTLSIYPSVHKQLIRTLFVARIVQYSKWTKKYHVFNEN